MLQPKDSYTRLFSVLKLGLPLFSPSNVQVGDVGFVNRTNGSFQLLYNVAAPDTNIHGHPPPLTLLGTKPDLTEWQAIHMRAKSGGRAEVSIQPPSAEGKAQFEFSNVGHGDAILVPGRIVRRDTLRREGELKKYFRTYLKWIAQTYCPRENILWNELILVIGTTKTNRWAVAVNVHEECKASLAFVVRGSGLNAWGEWSAKIGFEKCSPHDHVDTLDEEPTQTIFINRIKARGILRKIEATNEPGLGTRIWNGILG